MKKKESKAAEAFNGAYFDFYLLNDFEIAIGHAFRCF